MLLMIKGVNVAKNSFSHLFENTCVFQAVNVSPTSP